MSHQPSKAVILLSGGLDSYTAAAIIARDGFELYALTVAYGQRHIVEIEAARNVARALGGIRHLEVRVDLGTIGGSALTTAADVVPRTGGVEAARDPDHLRPGAEHGVPVAFARVG